MLKRLFIGLVLASALIGCRNTKEISNTVTHYDTIRVVVYDTVHYEDNTVKVVLEPKNDVDFETSSDLFSTISSSNYKVKEVEVKKEISDVINVLNVETNIKDEKTTVSEEKKHKETKKSDKSVQIVFICILIIVLILFVIFIYDKIMSMKWK